MSTNRHNIQPCHFSIGGQIAGLEASRNDVCMSLSLSRTCHPGKIEQGVLIVWEYHLVLFSAESMK